MDLNERESGEGTREGTRHRIFSALTAMEMCRASGAARRGAGPADSETRFDGELRSVAEQVVLQFKRLHARHDRFRPDLATATPHAEERREYGKQPMPWRRTCSEWSCC